MLWKDNGKKVTESVKNKLAKEDKQYLAHVFHPNQSKITPKEEDDILEYLESPY